MKVWRRDHEVHLHWLFAGSTAGSNVLGSRATGFDVDARGRVAIASTREDAWIHVWDAATGTPLYVLDGMENTPRCVAFSPDGKRVAAGGDDRSVRVWTLPD